MDALAEAWSRSGRNTNDLYQGRPMAIIKELKEWIIDRGERNHANITLLWEFLDNNATIIELATQYGNVDDVRIAPFKAKHVKNVARVKEAREDRDRLTLLADFLLSTLWHRGVRWEGLPCTLQWTEVDSEVCAYFKSVVPDFDAEAQLANFEMKEDVAEWLFRNTRQEAISAAVAIGMSERAIADGHHSIPHKGITATFVFGQDAQDSPASSGLPAPVDISGLLPPPHPSPGGSSTGTIRYRPAPLDTIEEEPAKIEDSPTGNITPPPSNTIKDKAAKTEVSAQALARWIEGLEEQLKPERQSKTKKRNTQRRKAKAKANEAATVEGVAGNSESK